MEVASIPAALSPILELIVVHDLEAAKAFTQYQDSCRRCYIRGPEGVIIALAEQLG
jgi:hypothetical protein